MKIHREKYVKIVKCPDIAKLTGVIQATRAAWGEKGLRLNHQHRLTVISADLCGEPENPWIPGQNLPKVQKEICTAKIATMRDLRTERRRRSYILLVLRWQDPSCQEGHGRCIDNSGVNQKDGHLDHIPGNGCRRDRQENIGGRFEQGDWPDGAANEQAKDLLQATAGHRSSFKICSTPASITVASMTRHHLI